MSAKDAGERKEQVVIRLEPSEGIHIVFNAKKPGLEAKTEVRSLGFNFQTDDGGGKHAQYTAEYQKLILDCIAGDQTFVSLKRRDRGNVAVHGSLRRGMEKRHGAASGADAPDLRVIADEAAAIDTAREAERSFTKEIRTQASARWAPASRGNGMRKGGAVAYNRHPEKAKELEAEGLESAADVDELIAKLPSPRVVWVTGDGGKAGGRTSFRQIPGQTRAGGLVSKLKKGDIVVDGGQLILQDSMRRSKLLAKRGIKFLDAGVSAARQARETARA